jgi:glycosyltransferase involved in cell wall biosynthesis
MNTCVIIPTFNESKTIAGVVREVRKQGLEVVVVDDGSQDGTSRVASECGAVVLHNIRNQGKGASLIKGFDYALSRNFDAVITMDGDGQHLATDIPYFMRLAKNSNCNVIIGNRMQKIKNMPWIRVITNSFMSWIISGIAGQKIPDTQCGFRLIKKEILEKVKFATCKYEIESEIIVKSCRMGFKIDSVPVKTVYNGEVSRIHPVMDTFRFIKFAIRELWITRF